LRYLEAFIRSPRSLLQAEQAQLPQPFLWAQTWEKLYFELLESLQEEKDALSSTKIA